MSEKHDSWKPWKRFAITVAALIILFLVAALARRPWIMPVAGVRTEMSRPFVRESDLGPRSAYRLLLKAIEEPPDVHLPEEGAKVWQNDWTDALAKLEVHPFPPVAPPPSPQSPAPARMPEEEPADADVLFPDSLLAPEPVEPPEEDPALAPEAPWTREQWEDIQRLAQLYEPSLAVLDQAIAAPDPQVPTADVIDFDLSYLQGVRQLACWLLVSARRRAALEDVAGAVRDIERILGMAAIVSRGGVLINHLVAYSCDAIAMQATWRLVTRFDLPPDLLRKLSHSLLEHADGTESVAEAFRAEALAVAGTVDMVYRDGLLAMRVFLHGGGSMATRLAGAANWLGPVVGSSPQTTKRNLMACYQHLVAIAEKPYRPASQAEYDLLEARLSGSASRGALSLLATRDPVGCLLASMALSGCGKLGAKAALHDALLRTLATFCAVEAYRKEEGRLPPTLEELVPGYLPSVPLDPFDGKPLRYLPGSVPNLRADAWAVYSIGADFTDDGGKAHSEGSPSWWRVANLDLIWPSWPYAVPGEGEGDPP